MVDVLSVLTRAIAPEIERLLFNVRIVRDLTTRVCVTRHHSKTPVKDIGQSLVNSPSSLLVGTESRIALQTAQALIKGNVPGRVRVLFDSGSLRSLVTTNAASNYGLEIVRKEWVLTHLDKQLRNRV